MKKATHYIRLSIWAQIILFSVISCNQPKTVNWNSTFDSKDKIPFGTFILYQEMEDLFPNNNIVKINYNLTEYLSENLFLSENAFTFIYPNMEFDSLEKIKLKEFTQNQNILFLSTQSTNLLSEEVKFNNPASISYSYSYKKIALSDSIAQLGLIDESLRQVTYQVKGNITGTYFTTLPSDAVILGNIKIQNEWQPNFIKIPYGSGWIYLHCEPLVFTNIGLLQEDVAQYAENVLSYIPSLTIQWNNYRIIQREYQQRSDGGAFAFLSFAWKQKPLKYGLIVLLISGLLYVLFNSSRRQKAVGYEAPYENDVLDYSESLVDNYKQSLNFKYLCSQKMTYFLNLIREYYYFTQFEYNDKFAAQLHSKSQVPLQECLVLVNYLKEISNKGYCTYNQFLKLSDLLDDFYLKSNMYGKYK